jgi:hypothetical protein
MKIIRCPYCIEAGGFRPMTVQSKGDRLSARFAGIWLAFGARF